MIKNVILIDDDRYKRQRISGYVREILPEATIHEYCCLREGHVALRREFIQTIKEKPKEWLVITDMVMPQYSTGEGMKADGGVHILNIMDWDNLKCPAIVASSEEVDNEKLLEVYNHYIGSVKENSSVYCKPYYEELINKVLQR